MVNFEVCDVVIIVEYGVGFVILNGDYKIGLWKLMLLYKVCAIYFFIAHYPLWMHFFSTKNSLLYPSCICPTLSRFTVFAYPYCGVSLVVSFFHSS